MTYTDAGFIIKKDISLNKLILLSYTGSESVVSVPDGVTHIDSYAFATEEKPNSTIQKIILPVSMKKVGTYAFAFCTALTEVQWPKNEKLSLGYCIFEGCDSLETFTIPKSVKKIASSIGLPAHIKHIVVHDDFVEVGQEVFGFNEDILDETVMNRQREKTREILLKNPTYKIIDGFMVNTKHKAALFQIEKGKKEVRIPYGIESLGCDCFDEGIDSAVIKNFVAVEKIVLPKSVKKVNTSAISDCCSLKEVVYEGLSVDITFANDAIWMCDILGQKTIIICKDTAIKEKKASGLRFERLILIHRTIASGSYPNSEQLRQLCKDRLGLKKLGISTISRDIDFLRSRFHAPIEYNYFRRGYYYYEDFSLNFDAGGILTRKDFLRSLIISLY